MTCRICLYAHYDPYGRIAPHVLHYLKQLHESDFTTCIALSGMDRISSNDHAVLRSFGVRPYFRRNVGLDFGAWSDLVAAGCAEGADTILLANDSVFGPLHPLAPIVERMQARNLDVWGMVESKEAGWHLQSWFLCFSAAAFASPAVARVLRQPFHLMRKAEIVLHGEIGLGAAILADRLTWGACWRQPDRRLRRLIPGNAMHLDYLSVMRSGAVPFVKIELLRDNPAAIPWIAGWRRQVATSPIFPPAWIDAHLAGSAAHRAPKPRQSLRMRLLYAAISRDQPEALRSLLW